MICRNFVSTLLFEIFFKFSEICSKLLFEILLALIAI